MILADALKKINAQDGLVIIWRKMIKAEDLPEYITDDLDFFVGICKYESGTLVSLDGDDYSLDDEIIKYEEGETTDGKKCLNVWY